MCIVHTVLSNVNDKINYLLEFSEANAELTGRQHEGDSIYSNGFDERGRSMHIFKNERNPFINGKTAVWRRVTLDGMYSVAVIDNKI